MWRTVRVTMLDPMNMTLGHIDSSSLDLCQKSLALLSPHADRHAGGISFTVFLFVCPQDFW